MLHKIGEWWGKNADFLWDIAAKLLKWVIFGVAIALLPFVILAWHIWTNSPNPSMNLSSLWPRGELLLVVVAIASDAFGELLGTGRKMLFWKILCGGTCALIAVTAAACFADAQTSATPVKEKISHASILVLYGTIVCGGGCKVLGEVKS